MTTTKGNLMPVQRKVQAGALGGALGIIIAWILSGPLGLDVPAEVGAAISTVCSFALAWLIPAKDQELEPLPVAPAPPPAIPDEPMPADPGAP